MTATERELKRAERRVAVLEIRAITVKREVRLLRRQTVEDVKR
jgi:hypothetical protein